MKMHFIKKNLWAYVEGTKEDPAKDTKALSYIVEEVREIIFNDIRYLTSGREAWKILAETYEDKIIIRKVSIIKTLVNTRYTDCKDMSDYLHRAISTYQPLKSTGVKPDEELIAGIILANSPDRFEPLIMALKNCGEVITVDNVKNCLLAEDLESLVNESKEYAFVNKNLGGKSYFKGKCFKCHLFGYKSSNCQQPPLQKAGYNKSKFSKKGNVGLKHTKKEEAYVAEIHMADSNPDPNIWYMDSCASYHMTPHKELLDDQLVFIK